MRTRLAVLVLLASAGCGSTPTEQGEDVAAQTPTGAVPAQSTSPAGATSTPQGAASPTTSGATAGMSSNESSAGMSGAAASSGQSSAMTDTSSSAGATAPPSAAGAGSGGASASSGGMSRDIGNYFESGAWHGYVFATAQGMGTTISPMDFSAQTTGMPRCVKGSVAASMDYSAIAQLGFELTDSGGVTPTKAGVQVDITNNGGSPLRFQVESPDGMTRWCVPLTGSGGFFPWTSFNTACWDNSGMAYNNEPIAKAMVLVPSTTSAEVPFDFCVNALAEADAAATGGAQSGGAGSDSAGTAGTDAAGGAGGAGANMMSGGDSVTPLQGGCDGYATGYWDCCKPHCGWKDNVPGASPLAACDKSDNSLGGDYDAKNACEAGGTAYQCHSLVPWAVNDKLAYGFAAVGANADRDICGKCYQLEFTGVSFNAGEDPGSSALAGKTMIVQAINIGSDVSNGQFDLLVPGRGVGMFDACSSQWGVPTSELGQQYGGFLPVCKTQHGRTDHAALKSCVMQSCMNVFEARGLTELAAGCQWFVDWFQVADNPSLKYKQVSCPAELMNKGMQRNLTPSDACLR